MAAIGSRGALLGAGFVLGLLPGALWAASSGSTMGDIETTSPRSPVALPEIEVPVHEDAKLPDGVKVQIKGFEFTGNTVFSSDELQGLLSDAVGREMSLAGLLEQVRAVTRHYRAAGYPVARAYLPAQEVSNGMITVGVLEGNLGEVVVDGDEVKLREWVREGYLRQLREQDVLRSKELERSLLLLNDLAGVSANASLRPGSATGQADVAVHLRKTPTVTGSIDVNNFGSEYTGRWRIGGQLNLNNILGGGEQIYLRPVVSHDGKTRYGQIGATVPVGSYGTRLGLSYSQVASNVGNQFSVLDLEGESRVFSASVTHPFVRSRHANVYGSVRFDAKEVEDQLQNAMGLALNREDKLQVLTAGVNGDARDDYYGGGTYTYSLSVSHGFKGLTVTATDPLAKGEFTKANWDVSRLQRLGTFGNSLSNTSLFLRFAGQYSPDRLVGSEQMALGGPRAVRAFSAGEAMGDSAMLLTTEVRQNFNGYAGKYFDHVQGYVGLDLGMSARNHLLAGEPDEFVRSGLAVGVKVGKTHDYIIDAGVAGDLFGDGASAGGDDVHFLLQAVKWFE